MNLALTTLHSSVPEGAIRNKAIETTVYGYASEYFYLENESKFSFDGHAYLVDIYLDTHPYQVIEKSAQMGASILAMAKAFYVCDELAGNTIYFFPTDSDVLEFSKARVGPIIMNSPHLTGITGGAADALGLRRVNRGWLYFRGMKSKIGMKSIPGDFLVFDELDEVSESSESLADQRLNHSSLKWRLKLSTPTFEGYGIDREFKKSDQRYWNLLCRSCGARTIAEKTFPDCVKRLSETKCVLICHKCKRELDTQYGQWIPEHKTDRIRGYHMCGLYSSFIDLSDLMYDYKEGRQLDELMRSKLGIPYASADQRITLDAVYACQGEFDMHTERHTHLGVDQKGDMLHLVITKYNKVSGKHEKIFIGKVKEFGQLDEYMHRYDIDLCVTDGLPNQHSARDFSRRFPGRVYLCYYQDNQKGEYSWKEADTTAGRDYQVVVNRTEALDAMYEQITRREIAIPRRCPEVEEFAKQLTNLARVNETEDDGTIMRSVWKRLGEDHFAHANSYSLIAQSRFGTQKPTSVMMKSPNMSRIISPRSRVGLY